MPKYKRNKKNRNDLRSTSQCEMSNTDRDTRNRSFSSCSEVGKHDSRTEQQSGATGNNVLEIPGFFYDKEKKRYFKIAPNHATSSCVYTQDAIAKKNAETRRQKDVLQMFEKPVHLEAQKKHTFSNNLTVLIQERLTYGTRKVCIKAAVFKNCVNHLKPLGSQYLFDPQFLHDYENLEHMQVMHVGSEHDELLCLWSIKETWIQRIQIVHVSEASRSERQSSLSVVARPQLQPLLPCLNKVTDLCWAPVSPAGKHVLYTTMCHMGHQESLAVIKSLEPGNTSSNQDYNLGKKATWTCAWNKPRCQFSVGSEKCVLVLNVERRTLWEYNTNKSDPLSLAFSQCSGNSLHTGTRRGQILTFDMRSRSTYPVSTLQHYSSVCSLQELENSNFLLAADFTGKICLWDVRKKNIVVQYHGNINQYTRLPVHVDEMQKIIYTVGEDGYTRFWSLDQGKQLYKIPPPCSVSRETIPCVQLSTRWGNRDGNMGLIMGLKNKIYTYGTLPLT